MASVSALDVRPVVAKVKLLLNKHLINILKDQRLSHSGVKAVMQDRIIKQIEEYARLNDSAGFHRLRSIVFNPELVQSPGTAKLNSNSPTTPSYPASHMAKNPHRPYGVAGPNASPYPSPIGRLLFKESAFETVLEPLTAVHTCSVHQHTHAAPAMHNHRNTVNTPIRLSRTMVERLKADPSLRIMLYCASETGVGLFSKLDVAFPHQVEVKVNHADVKANLRGLKNKPGSTRPADLTEYLQKVEKYENIVSLTYALTHKKFYCVVNLVRSHSVTELVARLKGGKSISKESVIREMVVKAQDSDLIATSTVMSLKCPLSTLRLELACRSMVCTHMQCFDATSFLQLQEQAPTWICPICNKIISFEALAVDQYVMEILQSTSSSVEQVTIDPTGVWSTNQGGEEGNAGNLPNGLGQANGAAGEDIIEVGQARVGGLKLEQPATPSPLRSGIATPQHDSAARGASGKRPISEVIDLTLSDSDEDDEPPRSAKRQQTRSFPDGVPTVYGGTYHGDGGHRLAAVNFRIPDMNSRAPGDTQLAYR